ncbi:hypothetical protein GE061_003327 [Apolygus lucorum]|uniref:THAP-type domain-containing protein n=1 Tax=Apolygus lucorum TaxID=248454 RepID=A0A6A4JMP6_APOLU|nr:hypothetical protein GE061_003327 [Apolygus lucorum]
MVSCVVPGCSSSLDKRVLHARRLAGVAFHRFPKDENLKKQWIANINRPNWQPSETSTVCTLHFAEKFVNRTYVASGPRLRENAVPTILDWSLQTNESQPSTSSGTVDGGKEESTSCFVPFCRAQGSYKFNVPKDPQSRKIWESAIKRIDGRVMTEDDVVCEVHFLRKMVKKVETKNEKGVYRVTKTLLEDAIPIILHGNYEKSTGRPKKSSRSTPSKSSTQENNPVKKERVIRRERCCVPNCPSVKTPTITLHRFPTKKSVIKTWLNLLNMTGFQPTIRNKVCCKHFSSSSFSKPGNLRPDAIPKKIKQDSDADLISEAEKTAAWLQSIKEKRERQYQKKLLKDADPVTSKPRRKKDLNPWGVKDCAVLVNAKERKLADDALLECDYDPMSMLKILGVPMPIVQVKEEEPEEMDLTFDDEMDALMPPSPVRPLRPILPHPKPTIKQLPSASPLDVPPLVTSNNLVFQTSMHSASEVKSAQDRPLPPSTIYRVIIPTSVQGHTIEPNSILEQLKEKISAMHQEKVVKFFNTSQVPSSELSTPSKPLPATIPPPLTPISSKSTPNILRASLQSNSNGQTTPLDPSKLILVDDSFNSEKSPVGDHDYASPPNTSSWPILIQNQVPSVLPTPTDIKLLASTSSFPVTPSQSIRSSTQNQPMAASKNSSRKQTAHVPINSAQKQQALVSISGAQKQPASASTNPVVTPAPSNVALNQGTPVTSHITQKTQLGNSTLKVVPCTPSKPPILQLPVLNLPSLVPFLELKNQGGRLQKVPQDSSDLGTSYVKVPVPGQKNASYVAVRSLTVGTQTTMAIAANVNQQQAQRAIKSNEVNKTKLKRLRQSLRRTQDRLYKATKELEDLKSMKTLIQDMERGMDNVVVVETTNKCSCYQQRREHEDMGDLLRYAVQKKIPPPEESKVKLLETEKLLKRIELIKRKLQQKEILKVVVLQTEDILPVV